MQAKETRAIFFTTGSSPIDARATYVFHNSPRCSLVARLWAFLLFIAQDDVAQYVPLLDPAENLAALLRRHMHRCAGLRTALLVSLFRVGFHPFLNFVSLKDFVRAFNFVDRIVLPQQFSRLDKSGLFAG
jgi:hypothetical protein